MEEIKGEEARQVLPLPVPEVLVEVLQEPTRQTQEKRRRKGFLSKLASKVGLGRYFGGGSGGGSSGNFYRGKSSGQGKLKTASKASKGRLKSPEDILRENFNRNMRRRNLANSPEFGSSRTSLFQNICEHYDNYARSHSIPDNRKHCPRD